MSTSEDHESTAANYASSAADPLNLKSHIKPLSDIQQTQANTRRRRTPAYAIFSSGDSKTTNTTNARISISSICSSRSTTTSAMPRSRISPTSSSCASWSGDPSSPTSSSPACSSTAPSPLDRSRSSPQWPTPSSTPYRTSP